MESKASKKQIASLFNQFSLELIKKLGELEIKEEFEGIFQEIEDLRSLIVEWEELNIKKRVPGNL